jgi:3-phenylpropionate/trans-cinnamate dioxygenase ferredoxin reductase subunit
MGATTVIVGASHAGVQCAASLRDNGYDGGIVLLSDEPYLPYHRPPLSKTLVSAEGPKLQPLRPAGFFTDKAIELLPETPVAALELRERRVATGAGRTIPFDALVIATGARPVLPPFPGRDLAGVLTLRDLRDAAALGTALEAAGDVVIIGGGMIGLEFAAVAARAGRAVTVVEAAPRVLGRTVSADTADHLAAAHRARGVRLLLGDGVAALQGDTRVRAVATRSGARLPADLVLVAVGVVPNAGIAAAAGLGGSDGIPVGGFLETAAAGVYAIGDCALHPNPHAGTALRVESVQNATDQGRAVAAAIAGRAAPYAALPWFWSDQYELKLQIAGITHGHDRTVRRFDEATGRLSVFCFREGRLLGVETINNARDHMAARRLLGGGLVGGLGLTPAEAADPDFDIGALSKQIAAE